MLSHDQLTEKLRAAKNRVDTIKAKFQQLQQQQQQIAAVQNQVARDLVTAEGQYQQITDLLALSLNSEMPPERGNLVAAEANGESA